MPFLLAPLVLLLAAAPPASAAAGAPVTTFPKDYASAPSYRYANMSGTACLAELGKRRVAFKRVKRARGVDTPVRIPAGVGGISYHTLLPPAKRPSSPWEVFDCRLVLALDDLSAILVRRGVDEAIIFSAWRPPGKTWPVDKQARRHPGALAVDIMRLRVATPPVPAVTGDKAKSAPAKPSYRWLDVEKDFHGNIGDATCGPAAPSPATAEGKELRTIVCDLADARIFSSILTPNFDRAHFNHLHLEVTPRVKWRILR